MNARMLETEKDGEVFLWIRSIVDRWSEEKEYRKIAEELLHRWVARKDGATFEGDIQTNARQIHYNILTSAGIDPTTEPWNSLIDLAIKDDDPPASSWNVSISGLCGRLQTILCLAALGWDGPTPKLSIARSIDTP